MEEHFGISIKHVNGLVGEPPITYNIDTNTFVINDKAPFSIHLKNNLDSFYFDYDEILCYLFWTQKQVGRWSNLDGQVKDDEGYVQRVTGLIHEFEQKVTDVNNEWATKILNIKKDEEQLKRDEDKRIEELLEQPKDIENDEKEINKKETTGEKHQRWLKIARKHGNFNKLPFHVNCMHCASVDSMHKIDPRVYPGRAEGSVKIIDVRDKKYLQVFGILDRDGKPTAKFVASPPYTIARFNGYFSSKELTDLEVSEYNLISKWALTNGPDGLDLPPFPNNLCWESYRGNDQRVKEFQARLKEYEKWRGAYWNSMNSNNPTKAQRDWYLNSKQSIELVQWLFKNISHNVMIIESLSTFTFGVERINKNVDLSRVKSIVGEAKGEIKTRWHQLKRLTVKQLKTEFVSVLNAEPKESEINEPDRMIRKILEDEFQSMYPNDSRDQIRDKIYRQIKGWEGA